MSLHEWQALRREHLAQSLAAFLNVTEANVATGSGVETMHPYLRDIFRVDPAARFRWRAEELERVRKFLQETEARFGELLASLRGEDRRSGHLRVVVDNTRVLP